MYIQYGIDHWHNNIQHQYDIESCSICHRQKRNAAVCRCILISRATICIINTTLICVSMCNATVNTYQILKQCAIEIGALSHPSALFGHFGGSRYSCGSPAGVAWLQPCQMRWPTYQSKQFEFKMRSRWFVLCQLHSLSLFVLRFSCNQLIHCDSTTTHFDDTVVIVVDR